MKVESTISPSPVGIPPEIETEDPSVRREIINRLLRASGLLEAMEERQPIRVSRSWHPLQVRQRQFNDHDFRINAPYGMLGVAVNADEPLLRRLVAFCERKKLEYTQLGDYDMARLYGNRQDMVKGMLSHLVRFGLL